MTKRITINLLLGLGLAVVGQIAQMIGAALLPVLGLPKPYDMAPEDGSVPPDLLTQIDRSFWIAAVLMLLVGLGAAFAVRVRGWREGALHGVLWAAIVALVQALLGLGEGVVNVMGLPGMWAYVVALALGATAGGWLRATRR